MTLERMAFDAMVYSFITVISGQMKLESIDLGAIACVCG